MIAIMSSELIDCLRSYPHRTRQVPPDSVVFRRDTHVRSLFIVVDGTVELHRTTEVGNTLVLQRAISSTVLAEASIYSERYHCDAVALERTKLLEFSKRKLLKSISDEARLAHLWGAYLSATIQNVRQRAAILSRRTVAERVDGWLAMNGSKLPTKGQWKNIATEIGITPESLYRELAKRRDRPTI